MSTGLMELEIITFVISVPIPIPTPMPRFQCRGLQMAIYHLGNFNDLIQSGFTVIWKIVFANFCTTYHAYYSIFELSLWMKELGEEWELKRWNISKTKIAI